MITLQKVLIDALWILGLAGILATFSYVEWYRSLKHWPWGRVFKTPRFWLPLCLSLTLFNLGVVLNGLVTIPRSAWWETVTWGGLTLYFLIQMVLYGMAGVKHGWDTSTEGKMSYERQTLS